VVFAQLWDPANCRFLDPINFWRSSVRACLDMPSPEFADKVASIAAVVMKVLLLTGIALHEQRYFGKHALDMAAGAVGLDYVEGALMSLYKHVRNRACSSEAGCFHWTSAKYTFGCRVSAWMPWCRAAKAWLLRSSDERRLPGGQGPRLQAISLQHAMQQAGVNFSGGQDLCEVHSAVDAAVNEVVGGCGQGAHPGFINISRGRSSACTTTADPSLLCFFVACAAGRPHTLELGVGMGPVTCCDGSYRHEPADLAALNGWPRPPAYQAAAGENLPDPHFWHGSGAYLWENVPGDIGDVGGDDGGGGGGGGEPDLMERAMEASTMVIYVPVTLEVWSQLVAGGKRFHLGWGMYTQDAWARLVARAGWVMFGVGGSTVEFKLGRVRFFCSHQLAISSLAERDISPSQIISNDENGELVVTYTAVLKYYFWLYCERLVQNKAKTTAERAPMYTLEKFIEKEKSRGVMVMELGVMGRKTHQFSATREKKYAKKRKRSSADAQSEDA
jgi:hypothetical protein